MIDCYRDDSVMHHVGVARAAVRGDVREAWRHWTDRRNLTSLRAAMQTAKARMRTETEGWPASATDLQPNLHNSPEADARLSLREP
jgi:hypothetical protein